MRSLLPNLSKLGLGHAGELASGTFPAGLNKDIDVVGAYGFAQELSSGKDTPSGHWESACVPVLFEWGYFHDHHNSFPEELLDAIVENGRSAGLPRQLPRLRYPRAWMIWAKSRFRTGAS